MIQTDATCEGSSHCVIVFGEEQRPATRSNTWTELQFVSSCCISAATPPGCLAVMVTMPSDVTFPNFSSGGSHGQSALPQPQTLRVMKDSRCHPGACKQLKTHTAHLCSLSFIHAAVNFVNYILRSLNNAAAGCTLTPLIKWNSRRNRSRDINRVLATTYFCKKPICAVVVLYT